MSVNITSQLEDSAFMFDAVWAAALALNNTEADLVNFSYDSEDAANISQYIYQEMLGLKFFGLTVSCLEISYFMIPCCTGVSFRYYYVICLN